MARAAVPPLELRADRCARRAHPPPRGLSDAQRINATKAAEDAAFFGEDSTPIAGTADVVGAYGGCRGVKGFDDRERGTGSW